jgi:hypothetical protein
MSAVREGAATERQIARWLASRGMPLGSDASGLPGAPGGWDAGRLALSKRTRTHPDPALALFHPSRSAVLRESDVGVDTAAYLNAVLPSCACPPPARVASLALPARSQAQGRGAAGRFAQGPGPAAGPDGLQSPRAVARGSADQPRNRPRRCVAQERYWYGAMAFV